MDPCYSALIEADQEKGQLRRIDISDRHGHAVKVHLVYFIKEEIEMVEGVCGLERDDCGTFERTGIRVGLHGESRVFYDRTHGSVGSMASAQVVMGPSFVYHDMECDDFPDRIVSGLIFMIPEG